jgi:diguanylate cyclase (GGDEF)-like protein
LSAVTRRPWGAACAVALVGLCLASGAGFAVSSFAGLGGPRVTDGCRAIGLLIFAVFATVCAGLAAGKARGRQRRAWVFLTIGLAGEIVALAMSTHYVVERGIDEAPFPLPSVFGFLLPAVGCVALVSFPVGYEGLSQARLLLDALIVEGSTFLVAWVVVLDRVYAETRANRVALSFSVALALAAMATFTTAVLVLARARTRQRVTLTLLTAGLALMAASDTGLVVFIASHRGIDFPVAGWAVALLTLGLAALSSLRASPASRAPAAPLPAPVQVWLPYVPLIVAAVIISLEYRSSLQTGLVLGTGVLLVMVVLARQFLVVTENRRLLGMLADQALHDPMTGLANRTLFDDRLAHAVQMHRRDQRPVAVLSLDLDDFKVINDSMGHSAGDELLKAAAQRLTGCVRTGDTVARVGGDEFAVVIEAADEDCHLVARRITEAFTTPFDVSGQQLVVRPSVGLVVAPPDAAQLSAEALLKQADAAMYAAKRLRSGGLQTFRAGMELATGDERDSPDRSDRKSARDGAVVVRLLGELRQAIERRELVTVYQPKFDLQSQEIVGAEALVRWPHPDRGLLCPEQFLPLVRQHGLMRAVTESVLAQALDDAVAWHRQGARIPVCVNLFAASLEDVFLPAHIVEALDNRELPADRLIVEITEDLLVEDMAAARAMLTTLRGNGIRIALDDFGSGYSALRNLRELPIDEVKLDSDFIAPILVDERAAAIVRAVIDLAHMLGVITVAEGVESAETAAALRDYGCEVAQGFYYSPPIAAPAVLELLTCCPNA